MGKKRKKRCYCGIGGQAVLEGVMMKNQDSYAVAVRRPDGEIELKKEDYKGIWGDKKITKIPFLRGVFNFIDSLVLGMSTLTWSAQFFEEDEPEKNIADQKKRPKSRSRRKRFRMQSQKTWMGKRMRRIRKRKNPARQKALQSAERLRCRF